jgi:hypothetical protein
MLCFQVVNISFCTIRTDPLFTETTYSLKVSATEEVSAMGVYSIVDGGYHNWVTAMSASRLITGADYTMYMAHSIVPEIRVLSTLFIDQVEGADGECSKGY